jgi:hypothetical protein
MTPVALQGVNQAVSLPIWAQIISLVLSCALASVEIAKQLRRAKLSIYLTRDLFFRFIEAGEALFCNAVMLARNSPVLIRDVSLELKRIGVPGQRRSAEKMYPLVVREFGEKVRGSALNAEHHFYGSSPLAYVPVMKPNRAVYFCLHQEYQMEQEFAFASFIEAVNLFRESQPRDSPADAAAAAVKLQQMITTAHGRMTALLQIEPGLYELSVVVSYVGATEFSRGKAKAARSKIKFEITDVILKNWKSSIEQLLIARAKQLLGVDQGDFEYPVLAPVRIQEGQIVES